MQPGAQNLMALVIEMCSSSADEHDRSTVNPGGKTVHVPAQIPLTWHPTAPASRSPLQPIPTLSLCRALLAPFGSCVLHQASYAPLPILASGLDEPAVSTRRLFSPASVRQQFSLSCTSCTFSSGSILVDSATWQQQSLTARSATITSFSSRRLLCRVTRSGQ
eukprot:366307-Chlamydomonas_euryale.AAC.5